jgi:transcription initiation factor IIF auxiliary subunit
MNQGGLLMKKFLTGKVVLITMVGLVGLWCTPVTQAQVRSQPPSAEQPTQQSPPQKALDDKALQSFAKAYVEVEKIQKSHQASLENAKDPAQMQKLQQEANAEITKAVEKQGFTPEAYMQVLTTVSSDNTLNKKALTLIQKERRG